jgi:hypothetical protein
MRRQALAAEPQTSAEADALAGDSRPRAKSEPANRLDTLLQLYEQQRRKRRDMRGRIVETSKDRTFGETLVIHANVLFKAPDFFRLDLSDSEGHPSDIWLWTDKEVRFYNFDQKHVWITKITPAEAKALNAELGRWGRFFTAGVWGQPTKDRYFGLPAAELKKRYKLRLTKEDKYYAYLEMQPRTDDARAEMTSGQLVLNQQTHQMRRLWLETVNLTEVTLDFAQVEVNADPPLSKARFFRGLPRGWDEDRAPVDGKPWDVERKD